jgi:hypothetical protein
MAENETSISDQLRAFILQDPRSPTRLAKEAGIDPSNVFRFLTGKRGINSKSIDKLARLLRLELVKR